MYRHLLGDSNLRLPINQWVIKISMSLVRVYMVSPMLSNVFTCILQMFIVFFPKKKYVLNEFFIKKTEQCKFSHMIYHAETATKPVYPQE